ncbi:hypothetical protein C1599_003966 [Escherichia coli]|nr:hypothetical protein [Escherichia coli]EEY5736731.1 hypothetical protein [Escherichia coli]EFA9291617.1 hypothetical protein [Escherichia coli]EGI4318618.1 hypothetical protein [Escherichia coli]EIW2753395.1 hypothetical protein [Escherichia coli]
MIFHMDSLPDNEPYLWGDYLELWATVNTDKCFSRGDLASLFRSQANPKSRGYSDDKWNFAATFIDTRISLFGDDYPFYFSDDRDTLFLRKHNIADYNQNEKLYIALLACANIKYIENSHRDIFTSAFEKISYPIFQALMPEGATVKHCWASAGNSGHYTGLLFDKLTKIAQDFRCKANFSIEDFKPNDRGDGGIDILAWHDMGDNRESIPLALAQCGCSKTEWVAKQLEATPAKLWNLLPVLHPWSTYYFLPQDLRWHNRDWAHRSDFGAAIFVDRLRLVNLTKKYPQINHQDNLTFVDDLVAMDYMLS